MLMVVVVVVMEEVSIPALSFPHITFFCNYRPRPYIRLDCVGEILLSHLIDHIP